MLPLKVRVNVREMKGYSTFPGYSQLESHYQKQFNVISRSDFGEYSLSTSHGISKSFLKLSNISF